ncbi:HTH domain-containing protein [Paenibacillus thiaminolyticus]|uniref:HTH domain-containing protein n=1 Tax=Paenibacillus thiaminolyticus TaxID=49283 RepID=UPI002175BAF6|nr:HTH domain-containing protein [Paenibacillus thiaminolyticus]
MRVDRLLSMLLIIAQRGKVTGQELAEHFEVSLRTIYRDIAKLGEAGVRSRPSAARAEAAT